MERAQVGRGDLLYYPGELKPADSIGVKVSLEDDHAHLVKHNREIILLHGTSEIDGRIALPGDKMYDDDGALIAALRLDAPVLTKAGDRFVLRLPTPSLLIGGGLVIDPQLPPLRRSSREKWQALKEAATLTVSDLLIYKLGSDLMIREDRPLLQSMFPAEKVREAVGELLNNKTVLKRGGFLVLKSVWDRLSDEIVERVSQFHEKNPHLEAMPMANLQSTLDCPEKLLDFLIESLISQQKLARFQAGIKLSSYAAGLAGELAHVKDDLVAKLRDPDKPVMTRQEVLASHKQARDVYAFLKQRDEIVETGGMVFLRETYDTLVAEIINLIKRKGKVTVADARDATGTSRKVVLPVLEEMDRQRITKRDGDYRELQQ
jgi:selenocysteine-specific elongation factor